jgi:hypothetical protein
LFSFWLPGFRFAHPGYGAFPSLFGPARKNEFVEPDQGDLGRPVPYVKIFQFSFDPNHFYIPRHPGPLQGRFAIVTNVGQGCGGRGCALGERREADGEVVWS